MWNTFKMKLFQGEQKKQLYCVIFEFSDNILIV